MQQALLDHLRKITEEEQRILDGASEVDQGAVYIRKRTFTVDSAKNAGGGGADRSADPHQICAFSRLTGIILSRCFMCARLAYQYHRRKAGGY